MQLQTELIQRLTMVKSLLDLGDLELVSIFSTRLEAHCGETLINEILIALNEYRYYEAAKLIEKILPEEKQLVSGIDQEITILEAELERVADELADLETELIGLERLALIFLAVQNETLGNRISCLLKLRVQVLQMQINSHPEKHSAYEKSHREYEEFERTVESQKKIDSQIKWYLSNEEQTELNRLFRKGAKIYHMLINTQVPEHCKRSLGIFIKLRKAYNEGDLKYIKVLLLRIECVFFDVAKTSEKDSKCRIEILNARIAFSRKLLAFLREDILNLKDSSACQTFVNYPDRLDFYENQAKAIDKEIKTLSVFIETAEDNPSKVNTHRFIRSDVGTLVYKVEQHVNLVDRLVGEIRFRELARVNREIAIACLECSNEINTYEHRALDIDDVESTISGFFGWVSLNSLTNLSDQSAEALSLYKTRYSLNGLTSLSEQAAQSLSRNSGDLSLDGLTHLSNEVAEALSKHSGELSLNGLTSLSDQAAESIFRHDNRLSLNGLIRLSDVATEALYRHEGRRISLDGLTSLSDQAAVALSQHKEWISLNGLTTLSDRAAEALSQIRTVIRLNGLTSLSGQAAEAISRQTQFLSLNGLTTLCDKAVEALSRQKGRGLSLDGLISLSDQAAKSLSWHEGKMLSLNGLPILSDQVAEAISRHKGELLFLNGLASLNVQVAKALSKYIGELYLNGLSSLSIEVAEAISHQFWMLSLNGLTTLSDEVAEVLSRNKGRISLNGITTISDQAALSLSQQRGMSLSLNGLTRLSDQAAEALSQYKDALSLNGLTGLSDQAAESLSRHEGRLSVKGLTSLSDKAEQMLKIHNKINF